MKKIITWTWLVLFLLGLSATMIAQPAAIQYQAVIRNAAGNPLINQSLELRMGIFQDAMIITRVYEERHITSTNNFGLATVAIGNGVATFGTFSSINWSTGAFFLKVEVNTGSGYVDLGMTHLLSVPFALYAKDAGNDSDSQRLNLSGNTLSITGGNSVTLPSYTGGTGINVTGTTISNTGDLSATNEIQTLNLLGNQLSISGGNSVTLPPDGLTLPFSGNHITTGATTFEIINNTAGSGVGIVGRHGAGSTIGIMNNGAIFGTSKQGYGVVGYSSAGGTISGVLGRSDQSSGIGVFGFASNGGRGGYFETSGTGAALATGPGNVGIGVADPDVKLEVNGVMRINSNIGRLEIGYPNNGDKWYFSTLDGGESLVLNNQLSGASASQRMFFNKEGRVVIGNTTTPGGRLRIRHNSTVADPQLLLTEEGSDYARVTFQNVQESSFWSIAGYTTADSTQDRLNLFHSGFGDVLSLNGKGIVGIRTISPISDLHLIHREIKEFSTESGRMGLRLQNAGSNGNFWNLYVQNANGNLELYFKNALKGYFNDGTGIYTPASDERLKKDIQPLGATLESVLQLEPKRYRFKDQSEDEPKTIGMLAQEVAKLFPELVQHGGDAGADTYMMDYSGFGVIAIKAIQEQQQLINEQQKTIQMLLQRIEKLEKSIPQPKNE